VQFADYVKLLGVTLDSTLSFDKHLYKSYSTLPIDLLQQVTNNENC